jgi:hypothetical protein
MYSIKKVVLLVNRVSISSGIDAIKQISFTRKHHNGNRTAGYAALYNIFAGRKCSDGNSTYSDRNYNALSRFKPL